MKTKVIYFHKEYHIEVNPESSATTVLERVYESRAEAYVPEAGRGISIQQGSKLLGFSVDSVQVQLEAACDVFLVHLRTY